MAQSTQPADATAGTPVNLAETGTIYSYTIVQDPPEGYEEQTPYVLALIQLDAGPMLTAQVTDLDEALSIGDRVEMVTRKLTSQGERGTIVYGYKFRKLLST